MMVGNIILLLLITFYLVISILSFFIMGALLSNLSAFNGHCLLYADGEWENTSSPETSHLINIDWGQTSNCYFPVFSSILNIILCGICVTWLSVCVFRNLDVSWLSAFTCTVTSFMCSLFTLISGAIVTVGFQKWCNFLVKKYGRCEIADYDESFKGFDPSSSWIEMGIANVCLWISWLFWLLVCTLAGMKLYSYNKEENFFTSLRKERERFARSIPGLNPYTNIQV